MSSSTSRILVASLVVLAFAGSGHAAGLAQLCSAAKLKATGKAANALIGCHAAAAHKGIAVVSTCLAKAHTKLDDAFARADARGGCDATSSSAVVGAVLDSDVGTIVASLRPVADANRCTVLKLKATGKKTAATLGCHANASQQNAAVDGTCLAKAEARFLTAFAKAEAKPPCLTIGDAGSVEDAVDDLVDETASLLPVTTTTTTTTTLPPGEDCPCYTSVQLAALTPAFFDGLGAITCDGGGQPGISTVDGCTVFIPHGPSLSVPRAFLGVANSEFCGATTDLDPDDDGTCNFAPAVQSITPQQLVSCSQILTDSAIYQSLCP